MSAVRRIARPSEEDGEHERMEAEGDVEVESQEVHEQELNGKILYDMSGGTPHGRFAIANGAVWAADIRAAAKENNIRPSNSVCMQSMAREVARLRRENTRLQHEKDSAQQQGKVAVDLIVEIPAEALGILYGAQATQVTKSSHVGLESTNDDVAANEGLRGGNRVALENCNNHNRPAGSDAGAGASSLNQNS